MGSFGKTAVKSRTFGFYATRCMSSIQSDATLSRTLTEETTVFQLGAGLLTLIKKPKGVLRISFSI